MAKSRTSGQGRPKGAKNKLTKALKDMILGALDDVGGQAYLAEQARKNPNAFLTLVGRVVPQELKADLTGKTTFVVERAYGEGERLQ